MSTKQPAPRDIDEYIARFPEPVQELLEAIRLTIKTAAPDAQETISYQIPTFTLNGRYLIYVAAFRKHISVYPAPFGQVEFEEALAQYGSGKGTLKFPLSSPIPFDLITRVVKFRVKEHLERAAAKGQQQ